MHVRQFTYFILGPALGLLLLLANISSRAQTPPPSEYQLKAAFIYNFAKFIDWPPEAFANAESPFIIGILGDDPFGKNLEQMVDAKTINTHPITIRKYRDAAEATKCHLLFISKSKVQQLPEIIQKLRGTSVLTVGETEQFVETGGMINFVNEGKKVRFQINNEATKAARLKLSSRLLSLAVPPEP